MAQDSVSLFLLWMFASMVALAGSQERPPCLTGTMTDVQSWVTATGELTSLVDVSRSLDLSALTNAEVYLERYVTWARSGHMELRYLSLARNSLPRIPPVFENHTEDGWNLAEMVEYLSFYGNHFVEISSPGENYEEILNATGAVEIKTGMVHRGGTRAMWSAGFQRVVFTRLKELDLRACGIATLDDNIFRNIPELEALYLSVNSISSINGNAFNGLSKLVHLDLSRNNGAHIHENAKHLTIESDDAFANLQSLRSLDFSYTKLNPRRVTALSRIGSQLERLSLCYAGNFRLEPGFFSNTSLETLDVSGNRMILETESALSGLEDTLTALYASEAGLKTFDIFENFSQLEILKLNNNEIVTVSDRTASSLISLQAVDLSRNRLVNWPRAIFSLMPALRLLDLRSNTINIINNNMFRDIANISFLALSENPMVCNCHAKEFIEIAARNEKITTQYLLIPTDNTQRADREFRFHTGFEDMNNVIANRTNITRFLSDDFEIDLNATGNFVLVDYGRKVYSCLSLPNGNKVPFEQVHVCQDPAIDITNIITKSRRHLFALIAIPGLLLPVLFFGYTYRRNLRYFCIMMRNSAMLSMVNENKRIDDDTIFNYDVFVSYCNEDRPWVLDQLLSHLENDCSVSLCLHERDFQVGLSILENIVSCMDRSKSIMLVISKQFLMSQWCQFEMHLAQHRLLETRREDLILILLEDIPRRLRPNTLHYLMLTKTYIVWPKTKSEQQVFWRRLKKSVTTQRHIENRVSLA